MSNIMIQNRGQLPVWGIRLLGKSDKDERQIGQFGTGLKEAIALLARMDCLPTIFSGELRVDFSIQTICEQAEICFRLSETRDQFEADRWIGMGLHPNFGARDWTDAWQAFREIVCNAEDAGGLHHDVLSNDPEGLPGHTRVYIPVNAKTLAAYSSLENRLLFLSPRESKQEMAEGRVLAKRPEEPKLQVYHKGVWVQEHKKTSLFDYEMPHLSLNESRSADWWSVDWYMGQIVGNFNQEQATAVFRAVAERRDFYELCVFERAAEHVDTEDCGWLKAFVSIYGENAVITNTDAHWWERLRARGYHPVVITDSNFEKLLVRAGVPCAISTLSKEEQHFEQLTAPSSATQGLFDGVWAALVDLELTGDKGKPSLMVYRAKASSTETILGLYDNGVCYVNEEVVGSEMEELTHLEEIAHHVSGACDMSRAFQNYLIKAAMKGLRCRR